MKIGTKNSDIVNPELHNCRIWVCTPYQEFCSPALSLIGQRCELGKPTRCTKYKGERLVCTYLDDERVP